MTTDTANRRRARRVDLWGAAAAAVLATLVSVTSLRLWNWRPGIPLSIVGDSPLVLTQLDDILRNGWFWSNSVVGFPLGQNASFYPELDVIHVLGVKLLGVFSSNPGTVGTLYFVMGYPLVAVTTYLLCRSERLSLGSSIVAAVLFAAAPYHAERFEHFWLAAYWTVPVALWLVLLVARGSTPVDPGGARSRARTVLWLLALALVGLSGAYYSGFTLILLAAVLVLRAWTGRPAGWWRGGLASLSGVAMVAALPLLAARGGMSGTPLTGIRPASRSPLESERYAGRIIDLMLPWEGHRVGPLADLTTLYQAAGRPVLETVALGVIGVSGVVALLVLGLRALATAREIPPRLLLWAALLVICGLFYTAGGLGSVVALLATPQLRTWSRLSLFILLLGLMAVGHWLSRPRTKGLAVALAAVVLVVGVLDQTSPRSAPNYGAIRGRLDGIGQYTGDLARAGGSGCGVFQLPVMRFPEGNLPSGYDINAQLLQHLTNQRLAWSHGGMSGTQAGDWSLGIGWQDPARLLSELRSAGFCAIEVDTAGIAADSPTVKALTDPLGVPVARSADGRLVAWSLGSIRSGSAADRVRLLQPVIVGITSGGIEVEGDKIHQDVGPLTSFSIENLSTSRVGPLTISVDVTSLGAPTREVAVSNGDLVLARSAVSDTVPTRLTFDVEAPPGYSRLDVRISGEPTRGSRDTSVSARFENLGASSTAPVRVASLHGQARSGLVVP